MRVSYITSNANGDYYRVKAAPEQVSVVHTKYDTLVCLKHRCLACEHTKAVREFFAGGGGPRHVAEESPTPVPPAESPVLP